MAPIVRFKLVHTAHGGDAVVVKEEATYPAGEATSDIDIAAMSCGEGDTLLATLFFTGAHE